MKCSTVQLLALAAITCFCGHLRAQDDPPSVNGATGCLKCHQGIEPIREDGSQMAADILELGESVVVDASWSSAEDRTAAAEIAEAAHADLVELRCRVDPGLADDRIRRRIVAGESRSEATPELAAAMRERFEEWADAQVIDTGTDVGTARERALGACGPG